MQIVTDREAAIVATLLAVPQEASIRDDGSQVWLGQLRLSYQMLRKLKDKGLINNGWASNEYKATSKARQALLEYWKL